MRFRQTSRASGSIYCGTYKYYNNKTGALLQTLEYNYTPGSIRSNVTRRLCWDELHKGPPWRSGGPLNLWAYNDGGLDPQPYSKTAVDKWGLGRYEYTGGACCTLSPSSLSSDYSLMQVVNNTGYIDYEDGSSTLFGDVSDEGHRAWHKFKPGQPTADLAVFLAEALEITRMLKTTAMFFKNVWKSIRSASGRKLAREAALQNLNTQFGWFPFVGDCRRLYDTHKTADRRIAQLLRDSGQWVLRSGTHRRTLEATDVVKSSTSPYVYPTLPSAMYGTSRGSCFLRLEDKQTIWFSGRFRYYIPKIRSVNWYPNMYRKLQGLTITPAVLWELVPFSWLIDWFTETGDFLNSQSDSGLVNNLAAKYAYIMGHTRTEASVRSITNYCDGSSQMLIFPYKIERKQRVGASPFGFGLKSADLSGRQIGILASLGITRMF